jgi:hypothetical protein
MDTKTTLHLKGSIESSQAIIFIDSEKNLAYKVFKSYQHPNSDKTSWSEDVFNNYKHKIFESERNAYELISQNTVKSYFPTYHPDVCIDKILDEGGFNISSQFLLQCVLVMDLIHGKAIKQAESETRNFCKEHAIDLEAIFNELKAIGVLFYKDSSVFCNEPGIKIVDIATNDFADYQPPLENKTDDPYEGLLL